MRPGKKWNVLKSRERKAWKRRKELKKQRRWRPKRSRVRNWKER